ncbi:fibronectin type III domain-containing protein, partial [Escherichia coli]|uniref:fibronectin type III domain-containing protein n=1 Tax=Escherichia coli TaxID=562 RepID=UPI0028DE2F46
FAEIAAAEAGPLFRNQARRIVASTRSFRSDLSKCHVHTAEFKDLEPGTRYAYRVGDGANWSEWFQFRTCSSSPEAFSFVYFGDAQTEIR